MLSPESSHLRGLAQIGIASSMYLRGNADGAVAYLEDQLALTSLDTIPHAGLLQGLAFTQWLTGDLTGLQVTARRLLGICEKLALPDQRALAQCFLGAVHYAWNELEIAERYVTEAFSARFNMRSVWWCQAAGLLALIYDATGRPEEARVILDDAHTFILEGHATRLLPNIEAYQAEINRRHGQLAAAIAWARDVDLVPLIWPLAILEPHLVQVLVLLSEDTDASLDQATLRLAELRALCERIPNQRLLIRVEAVEALLLERKGQHEAALETLERVVLAVEPEGWVRLFVDLGDDMASLLAELSGPRVATHTIERILAAFTTGQIDAHRPDQSHLIDPLSDRELEILTQLVKRESNKEIALQLFIAPSTVKRHTLNIYRKLGVNDRREAVARATEFGLLNGKIAS
jgi:LuxR family maltose regulon positive regulatory protein